jgi:hypothetical protein
MNSVQKRLQNWTSSLRNRLSRRTEESETSDSAPILVDCPHPSSTSASTDQYHELMNGSVPCPSCGGSGRIPKELEETLVALIPMSDDRLKPKKTVMYVSIGIGVCLIIAAFFIYVFLPRTVLLTTDSYPIEVVNVFDLDNQTQSHIEFYFFNAVNVTNSNYFPVEVVNVSATIISKFQPWSMDIVGNGFNTTEMRISPFGGNKQQIWFNNTVSLKGVVAEYCQAPFSKLTSLYVSLQFDIAVTLKYFYYSHQEQVTISTVQQACCLPTGNCTSAD